MDDFAVQSWITTVWNRITFSRLTIIYFCFSVLHFVAQITLQSRALMTNDSAFNNLAGMVTNKTELSSGLPILQGSTLRVCTFVPYNMQTNTSGCTVIWDAAMSNSSQLLSNFTSITQQTSSATQSTTTVSHVTFTTQQTSSAVQSTTPLSINSDAEPTIVSTASTTRHISPTAPTATFPQSTTSSAPFPSSTHVVTSSVSHGSNGTNPTQSANSTDLPIKSRQLATGAMQELRARSNIDSTCQASLAWPISELRDSQREDIVFIAFQCWILGVSIVALLNESIPHICASMITHLMATCWAAFRIYDTAVFRSNFNQVIVHGACNGVQNLSHYWDTRFRAEIAGLIINVVAMLISGYLTWKMFQVIQFLTVNFTSKTI
ncbi:hypothetical protein F5887DRAFT_942418 [Amanita rubescens]|nr:hypothetical protein F5887DRAFT_942418 [Amanita rubescens]